MPLVYAGAFDCQPSLKTSRRKFRGIRLNKVNKNIKKSLSVFQILTITNLGLANPYIDAIHKSIDNTPKDGVFSITQKANGQTTVMFVSFSDSGFTLETLDPKTSQTIEFVGTNNRRNWRFIPPKRAETNNGTLVLVDTKAPEISNDGKLLIESVNMLFQGIVLQALKLGIPYDNNSMKISHDGSFTGSINGEKSSGLFLFDNNRMTVAGANYNMKFGATNYMLEVSYSAHDKVSLLPKNIDIRSNQGGASVSYVVQETKKTRKFHDFNELLGLDKITIVNYTGKETAFHDLGIDEAKRPNTNESGTQKLPILLTVFLAMFAPIFLFVNRNKKHQKAQ